MISRTHEASGGGAVRLTASTWTSGLSLRREAEIQVANWTRTTPSSSQSRKALRTASQPTYSSRGGAGESSPNEIWSEVPPWRAREKRFRVRLDICDVVLCEIL